MRDFPEGLGQAATLPAHAGFRFAQQLTDNE